MKSILAILFLTILSGAILSAQDTARAPQRQGEKMLRGFLDENGNGIDDRLEGQPHQMKMRGMVRFIDLDGDGICDGREQGLGIQRGGKAGQRQYLQRGKR